MERKSRSTQKPFRKIHEIHDHNLRLKSLPRITSQFSIRNSLKNKPATKAELRMSSVKLIAGDANPVDTLDERMVRLNSLALRNQKKHNEWLSIQQKIIEMNNSYQKENSSHFVSLKLDKVMEKIGFGSLYRGNIYYK